MCTRDDSQLAEHDTTGVLISAHIVSHVHINSSNLQPGCTYTGFFSLCVWLPLLIRQSNSHEEQATNKDEENPARAVRHDGLSRQTNGQEYGRDDEGGEMRPNRLQTGASRLVKKKGKAERWRRRDETK